MKKIIHILPLIGIAVFLVYVLGFGIWDSISPNTWTNVTIQQIQTKSPDSLIVGKDKSDLLGDSVQIVARVVAPPRVSPAHNDFRTLLRGTSSWTCYAQDTAGGLYGGIVIRQGSRGPSTGIDLIDTGSIIRVRGMIEEFPASGYSNSLTQLSLDTTSGYTIDIIQNESNRPVPKLVNITDFATGDYTNGGTINYLGGEKYEGMYVEFRNVYVATGVANRQPWSIVDASGNKLYFRDFSNFFSTSPSGDSLRPWTHPLAGTLINYIRGVIISANNEGVFGTQLPYAIVPIYPNDLSLGNAPPQLSTPTRTPGVPTPPDSVLVTVTATDPALNPLTISDVRVFWRINGGAFNQKQMNATGNIYSTKMPPYSLGTFVEYFFKATDNLGASKLLPSDTLLSKLFYIVKASDSLSIQEVQWCPNNGGFSGYNGAYVRGIEGICTADTSDIRAFSFSGSGGTQSSPRRVILQNGTGAFSAIWIYNNATDIVHRGDRVRVRGTVENNFGVNRINVATASDVQILSSNNTLPAPENLPASVIANYKIGGDTTVKKWESVFIRLNTPVFVNCINAQTGISCLYQDPPLPDSTFRRNFGEILVIDNSLAAARIELQDGNHTVTNNWDGVTAGKTLLTKNDSISFVQGILYFAFSNYKLVPRRNTDFGTISPVGIKKVENEIANSYSLSQNYPNPFNPVTRINFSIPENAFVTLKVYDVLGKEIQTIINEKMNPGNYDITFNGTNLSSGIYFYRLVSEGKNGSRFIDTKKMILLK